jgi:putative Holliday junction resolvase
MGRILAIDYGTKRVGLAVSDPLQIIATALTTVPTQELLSYLQGYMAREEVEVLVVGLPKKLNAEDTNNTAPVKAFVKQLEKVFPHIPIRLVDERFTSKIALDTMIAGGSKKKDRRDKGRLDKISATIILQSYMESISNL